MAKLLPPYIDGGLPAQMGVGLAIPFRLNRGVSINQVKKMYARLKTVVTDRLIAVLETTSFSADEKKDGTYIASFNLSDLPETEKLLLGQTYKIQLAFGNEMQGYFSSIGIFKYTAKPRVYIEGLDDSIVGNLYTYVGVYSQSGEEGDQTEKVYNYSFEVTDTYGTLIASSGLCIHDSTSDLVEDMSSDTWVLNQQLRHGIVYNIKYTIYTVNGIVESCHYNIINNEIEDETLEDSYTLEAENDYNNGCIKVYLRSKEDAMLTGGFVVSRASDKDNYQTWNDIFKFALLDKAPLPKNLWVDYTAEQGVSYKYAIQRYNDAGFYSRRITNKEPVIADFEDIFIFDGKRQLKVRFNPKVTSFKNTILETKVDTLGGKYPFIFRNGNVKYKEFPVSGLISHLSDTDEMFMSNMELGFKEEFAHRHETHHQTELKSITRGTQVDRDNIKAERNFKLKALEWLTDGQPKLFKSPSEGNYIIRLMNTSMSPNDTVGRMLHTFQSTAYEMAEYTFENLMRYGFVENHIIDNRILAVESIDLNLKEFPYYNLIGKYPNGVKWAEFRNVPPGTIFNLQFLNGNGVVPIRIPSNGFYKVNIFNEPLMSIQLASIPEQYKQLSGRLDIGYYTQGIEIGDFSQIRKISIADVPSGTFFGGMNFDIVGRIEDVKFKIGRAYMIQLETRPTMDVYYNKGNYYYDNLFQDIVDIAPHYLYRILNQNENWMDGSSREVFSSSPDFSFTIQIGKDFERESVNLGSYDHAGIYVLKNIDDLEYLRIGSGLFVNMFYQRKEYIYGVEEDDEDLINIKQRWLNAESDEESKELYRQFITLLETKLQEV